VTVRTTPPKETLSGENLRQMIGAGLSSLEMNVELINSLNVFPVPDGDTGTNMFLTLKAADDALPLLTNATAHHVSEAVAKGTLMGARGNSGVILSQYFRGWADALHERDTFGVAEIASALSKAADAAYKAVSKPVEGTILTVIKAAAGGAQDAIIAKKTTPKEIWEHMCQAARQALESTPNLLPILKEAGVVDSGGLGMLAILEGTLAFLTGADIEPLVLETSQSTLGATYLKTTEEDAYGYCTQFLLQGADLDLEGTRARMNELADSAVVVGDSNTIMIHVHTYDPGSILSYGVSLGSLTQITIDNIDQQHREFLDLHNQPKRNVPVGVVGVVAGAGLQRLFRNLGCLELVHGGQKMNPSTRDLVNATQSAAAESVILLPNNSNIMSSALQAAKLSDKPLHIVNSTSILQGIAALLAFNPHMDTQTNINRMEAATKNVQSGEIVTSVRSAQVDGVTVQEGQAMAILDRKILASVDILTEAAHVLFKHMDTETGSVATIYWGGDANEDDARNLSVWIQSNYNWVETEVVYGGHPLYHYLISLE
jgi:DAK2 domain fusion protein YloV